MQNVDVALCAVMLDDLELLGKAVQALSPAQTAAVRAEKSDL
jgi:hypothetical protein